MTDQSHQFPRFFVTAPAPCPYLKGKMERKVFTDLSTADANELNETLGRVGFRRSQTVAYRPACEGCTACVSVRVLAKEFKPNRSLRRIVKDNKDLIATSNEPFATAEQYELLRSYLEARHPDGGMSGMDEFEYAEMVESTPVTTRIVEYREPASDDQSPGQGRLVATAITDVLSDGLSMIYSFFDTRLSSRSLGTYMILDHIRRTANANLSHVYLGYWVEGSRKMAYKTRFRPLEMLGKTGWKRKD